MFLTASPFVRAQDAASTPFQHKRPAAVEESLVSPTPEPIEPLTLQPIPTPTLEPIGSPLPKLTETIAPPTPKPIASQTPGLIAIPLARHKATPTPKPRATPRPKPTVAAASEPPSVPADSPVDPGDQSDIAIELKAQEQRWEGSFATHDISVTEQLVAADFIGVSSTGKVGNKTTMISQAGKDKNVYTSAVAEDMIVHSYGPNIAVVTGIVRETGTTPAGTAFSHAIRFMDTWVERNGEWQCVAASALTLPKK